MGIKDIVGLQIHQLALCTLVSIKDIDEHLGIKDMCGLQGHWKAYRTLVGIKDIGKHLGHRGASWTLVSILDIG